MALNSEAIAMCSFSFKFNGELISYFEQAKKNSNALKQIKRTIFSRRNSIQVFFIESKLTYFGLNFSALLWFYIPGLEKAGKAEILSKK